MNIHRILRSQLAVVLTAIVLGGCSAPKQPLFLAPDFRDAGIRTIALSPVTFDPRYEAPAYIDLDGELRRRLMTVLESKGYRTYLTQNGERENGAELRVHVDFLFISETLGDRQPPPVIDIEAEGRLVLASDGTVLWRDRGGGRVGGAGDTRIRYPATEHYLALTLLADHLLATLPWVGER